MSEWLMDAGEALELMSGLRQQVDSLLEERTTTYAKGYKHGWSDRDKLCLANCVCKEAKGIK